MAATAAAAAARHIAIFINIHKLKCSRKVFCMLIIDGTHDVISFNLSTSASFPFFFVMAFFFSFAYWLNLKPHFSGRRAYYIHILFLFHFILVKNASYVRSASAKTKDSEENLRVNILLVRLAVCMRTH